MSHVKSRNKVSVLYFRLQLRVSIRILVSNINYVPDPEEYKTYLATRPPEMELKALKLIMKMTEKYK